MAYQLIETVTLTAAASSIEFTAIPQDGVDLLCVLSARTDANSTSSPVTLNADTSNYSWRLLNGNGSSANSFNAIIQFFLRTCRNVDTASTFGNSSLYVSNYAGTSSKSVSIDSARETNATAAALDIKAGLYANSIGITTLKFSPSAGNYVSGSTASLYKIF